MPKCSQRRGQVRVNDKKGNCNDDARKRSKGFGSGYGVRGLRCAVLRPIVGFALRCLALRTVGGGYSWEITESRALSHKQNKTFAETQFRVGWFVIDSLVGEQNTRDLNKKTYNSGKWRGVA